MCGIAGIWNKNGNPVNQQELNIMVSRMKHRGPDARGTWYDKNIALGHSRLKIIDISNNANQPFTDGGDVLVFNGEIFNYNNLKKELSSSYNFITNSDTEVLFRCLQKWGTKALNKIEGQFAFAFYNKKDKKLLLARDHVGICPLYILNNENEIIFSSEIRPILEIRKSTLDKQGVLDYFSYRYNIQNGHTFFSTIKRFNPAHYCLIDLEKKTVSEKRYWRLKFRKRELTSNNNLQLNFNDIFDEEVKKQTIADVPVGMFLSGGIDSGALLNGFSKTNSPINTFTMSFDKNDEDLKRVNLMEQKMNFNKNILSFDSKSTENLEDVIFSLEEPFGDLIIAANYELARYASKHVKVVLSGEGGDEAFIGYDHQRAFLKMFNLSKIPLISTLISKTLTYLPAKVISLANGYPGGFGLSEKAQINKTFSKMNSPVDAYLEMITLFKSDELKKLFNSSFYNISSGKPDSKPIKELFSIDEYTWQSIMRAEIEQFTLIINLLKQERLGMRFSLEGRVPLVSKNVLDFTASLPLDSLFSKVNKQYLLGYSQSNIIKKKPFSVFASPEYKNTLLILMNKYVSQKSVEETGVLNWNYVKKLKLEIIQGGLLNIKKAMSILIFLIWWKSYKYYIKN